LIKLIRLIKLKRLESWKVDKGEKLIKLKSWKVEKLKSWKVDKVDRVEKLKVELLVKVFRLNGYIFED